MKVVGTVAVALVLFWGTFVSPGPWTGWIFTPMRWMHDYVLLAFALALLFGAAAVWCRRLAAVDPGLRWNTWKLAGCALVWAGYAVYELAMSRWERTVVAPIRVDLLLLAPVLYVVTGNGLFALWGGLRRVSAATLRAPAGG